MEPATQEPNTDKHETPHPARTKYGENIMSLIDHAKAEFNAAGWPGDCEMQQMVCENVLELLSVFASQRHSGSSAPYVLNVFQALAKFNPLVPLTGNDDEWLDVAEQNGTLYQNKRDSEVFKDDDGAYWIHGKIFREPNGCTYTSKDSRVPIEFPWTKPESEVVDVAAV